MAEEIFNLKIIQEKFAKKMECEIFISNFIKKKTINSRNIIKEIYYLIKMFI